jgi:acyl-coenzyme A thioesterase PaaI-like protein
MTQETAVQDLYPETVAHCYGCGRLNGEGLHVRTFWDDGAGVARFTPRPYHIAVPGYVYGGLLASLIDCHGIGTPAAAMLVREGKVPGRDPTPRFLTGSLHVECLKPTPAGHELVLTARPRDVWPHKVFVDVEIEAGGVVTGRGEVLAVRMPAQLRGGSRSGERPR